MKLRTFLTSLLVIGGGVLASASPDVDKDIINATIFQIFGTPPPTRLGQDCFTEDQRAGICVNQAKCKSGPGNDGIGDIDIRFSDDCAHYLDTCCLPENIVDDDDELTAAKAVERVGCGWSNPDGANMRTTGERDGETKFGEYPWVVMILSFVNGTPTYIGGGTLIHWKVVLTTAHYVFLSEKLRVRAGEWDVKTVEEPYPYQDRDVESFVVHPYFNSSNLQFDIALLFLEKEVERAPHVGVACLAKRWVQATPGAPCVATGWGKDKFEGGSFQAILKKIEVPAVNHTRCENMLRRTRLGRHFNLHHSFMCAGGELARDACRGDGGAPLACPIESQPGRLAVHGMVAWGIGCGRPGVPGVYASVAALRFWVDKQMQQRNLDASSYELLD